jgi:hypothetical protein
LQLGLDFAERPIGVLVMAHPAPKDARTTHSLAQASAYKLIGELLSE